MTDLTQAIKIIKEGGIVIFPTDTAYGIGCRIDKPDSVERLFNIRKRPESQATPVLADSFSMAQNYWYSPLPDKIRKLVQKYWPGALTIIFDCKREKVPALVRGNGKTLGIRMPDHIIPLELIKSAGVPVLGPSANFHGQKTPYKYEDLDPELIKLVDYVVKGECQTGHVSTVVDCSVTRWKIIRQGAIHIDYKITRSHSDRFHDSG